MASSAYFVVEMRQAGNDGLADPVLRPSPCSPSADDWLHGRKAGSPGPRGWNAGPLTLALGLGIPDQGAGDRAAGGRGGRRLPGDESSARFRACDCWSNGPGFLPCSWLLAMAWPVPVSWSATRPPCGSGGRRSARRRARSGIVHGNARGSVVLDWFWMTQPWTPLALLCRRLARCVARGRASRRVAPWLGFAWWWAFGNLAVLGLWTVAKPSYYLPCLPAVALLVGAEWVRIARSWPDGLARPPRSGLGPGGDPGELAFVPFDGHARDRRPGGRPDLT